MLSEYLTVVRKTETYVHACICIENLWKNSGNYWRDDSFLTQRPVGTTYQRSRRECDSEPHSVACVGGPTGAVPPQGESCTSCSGTRWAPGRQRGGHSTTGSRQQLHCALSLCLQYHVWFGVVFILFVCFGLKFQSHQLCASQACGARDISCSGLMGSAGRQPCCRPRQKQCQFLRRSCVGCGVPQQNWERSVEDTRILPWT